MPTRSLLTLLFLGLLLALSIPPTPPLVRASPPASSDDPLSWFESPNHAVFAKATADVKAQLEVLRQMLVRLQHERSRQYQDGLRLRKMLLTARRDNEALKQRLADQESRAELLEQRLSGTLMRQLLDRVAAVESSTKERILSLERDTDRRLAAAEAESKQRIAAAEAESKQRLAAAEAESKQRIAAAEAESKQRLEAVEAAQKKNFAQMYLWAGQQEKSRSEYRALVWFQRACAEGLAEACKAKEKPVYVAGQRQAVEHLPQGHAVYIPAGSFTMGSPQDEKQRDRDEGPQRTVTLTHGGWMLETEVTQGQFQALMGYNKSHFTSCGERCPVEMVSWHEAAAFANALSAKQGKDGCFTCTGSEQKFECSAKNLREYVHCPGWRLPTEAEWEYAARAGTTTRFHTGDCITSDQANFDGNYPPEGCPKGEYRQRPLPVGSLAKNAWGLFDMHGNVWEWVYDRYQDSYTGLATENPTGNSSASVRVVRGGSWYSLGQYLRAADRSRYSPADRYPFLGFRLFTLAP